MKKYLIIPVLLLSILLIEACNTVPITGRRQLSLVPKSELNAMSFQQYNTLIDEAPLSNNQQEVALLKKVGNNIKNAVQEYMRQNNDLNELEGYEWEFNLIQDDQVNAFAMPGGKVVFYTGILPICQGEAGIAVVMGHEVAHAIAQHGNERMSQGLATQFGGAALSAALSTKTAATQQLLMTAYGAGTQFGVLLPYSRLQESEADKLGMVFMAMAGYDPRTAPDFWQRMSAQGGAKPPEFMSTHPSDQTRIKDLKAFMPKALKYYKPN